MSPIAARLRRGGGGLVSINDPFSRNLSSGLGSTPEGFAYSHVIGAAADWLVDGSVAKIAAAASTDKIAVLDQGYSDADFAADIASVGGDAIFARVQDANNFFALAVNLTMVTTFCTNYVYGSYCSATTCGTCSYGQILSGTACGNCPPGSCTYQCFSTFCNRGAGFCSATGGTCSTACGTSPSYTTYLYRKLGGTLTQLWSTSGSLSRPRLIVHGTSIDVYDGAAAITSVIDANLTAATKFGIGRLASVGNGAPTFDNLALAPAA